MIVRFHMFVCLFVHTGSFVLTLFIFKAPNYVLAGWFFFLAERNIIKSACFRRVPALYTILKMVSKAMVLLALIAWEMPLCSAFQPGAPTQLHIWPLCESACGIAPRKPRRIW
jgi:hypothetical protein